MAGVVVMIIQDNHVISQQLDQLPAQYSTMCFLPGPFCIRLVIKCLLRASCDFGTVVYVPLFLQREKLPKGPVHVKFTEELKGQ